MAEHPSEFDPRAFLKAATAAGEGLCKARFEGFGRTGHASRNRPLPLEAMAQRYATPATLRAA